MKALQQKLEQREKTELIAIIQQMLRQEPDLQWVLTTPLPTSSSQKVSLDPEAYRQQVLNAMVVGDQLRKYKRDEVKRRLLAIKIFADELLNNGNMRQLSPFTRHWLPRSLHSITSIQTSMLHSAFFSPAVSMD
jgi:hypothetical protein